MKKNEMETFRQQLLKLERRLRSDVDTLADEAFHKTDGKAVGNLSDFPVDDPGELGFENYWEETTLGLVENAGARFEEINAALGRINAGIFGTCEECGQEIASIRLQAIPYARLCIQCARKAQQGQPAAPGNL